jgi:hypothetical protein
MAYSGPFADRNQCKCGKSRLDAAGKAQEFYTFPIGPQLQALFRSPESAKNMHYRRVKTQEILDISVYEDYLQGAEYLAAVERGDIKETDLVLIGSTVPQQEV